MEDRNLQMFKAYDIRTKYEALSKENIFDLANAIALYVKRNLKAGSVVLARDARLHSAELMEAMLETLPQYGLEVFVNTMQISTCQFYYMCMEKRESAGIMITASHNPGNYVGFKLIGPGVIPIASGCGPDGGILKIREYYEKKEKEETEGKGRITIFQRQEEYVRYSLGLAGIKKDEFKGMKVFAEFLSGSAGTDFAMAMDIAGAEYTPSHIVPDGYFPSGDPNPIIENSIAPAREKMKNGSYDIGFCFDGDGDRMDLMFPDGSQIIPGLNMAAIVPYIKKIFAPVFPQKRLSVYADVKAIPLALIEIAGKDVDIHIIRNGHSFIKEKLRLNASNGYIAAEEESAHYYMNFPFDLSDASKGFASVENTLFFALLSIKAMKEHREEYERIHELQKNIIRFREWPLMFKDPSKMEMIMDDVEKRMRKEGAAVIKDMDDGSSLDAVLMRINLPSEITAGTELPDSWCQVAERISRSEDAMTRWEVVASSKEICNRINDMIILIAQSYVEKGWAYF